jgi:hypothetical protein
MASNEGEERRLEARQTEEKKEVGDGEGKEDAW